MLVLLTYVVLAVDELDFWVNSSLNWAIELLRLGGRKGSHLAHFRDGGSYAALQPKAWRVLDFRPTGSRSPRQTPGYIVVIMDGDFKGASVQFERAEKDTRIRFRGVLEPKP